MTQYAAFLRGVMPTNCKMPQLKAAFEHAGFEDVRTVLGSGNVVFSARAGAEAGLQRRAEAAMLEQLGHAFPTIIRTVDYLRELLEADPYQKLKLPADAKRIVTFLRAPAKQKLKVPVEFEVERTTIVAVRPGEIFSAYRPNPKGPLFMGLIDRTFGKDVTTRTWDTIGKVAR